MSPEQAEGRPAGPASDVFALGCVIAYAATGAGPFGTGTAAAILYRVVHAEPDLGQGMPPRLREIVSRCLAKDPAARPAPRALAAMIAGGMSDTGPSAVTFWPRQVAGVIGAYQARLEQETADARRPAGEFSWSTVNHPRTTPGGPPSPPPRWPYGGPGTPGGPQAQAGAQGQAGAEAQAASLGAPVGVGSQGYPPPPRGYLPADGAGFPAGSGLPVNAGFPLGSGPANRGPVPASVRSAVRLMYAGAAYALLYAIGSIVVISAYFRNHPESAARHSLSGFVAVIILGALIEIALWLGIARACKRGKNWARITGTVLFGVHTLGVLGVLGDPHAGIAAAKLLTVVNWLISCGAVVFLWQRPSRAFFRRGPGAPG
jgi:hypothetical protein